MVEPRALRIARLPGDGIGPEVELAGWRVLEAVCRSTELRLEGTTHRIGGAALDRDGVPLPNETLEACRSADAILLGAVGGPRWDDVPIRPERGLLELRRELGLFANLRPIKPVLGVAKSASPLEPRYVDAVDLIFVRELTGGLYFGQPKGRKVVDGERIAVDTLEYGESQIRRVAQRAFDLARSRRHRVTSVDKANVLESSRLWREVVNEVHRDYPEVELEHQLVDSMAMRLLTHAKTYDVVLTTNMFGDILTDEAALLGGSLGLLPSASLGDGRRGLYEPIHGSAPDLAGHGLANPLATILSVALLLRHSARAPLAADRVETAVLETIAEGHTTPDLGGSLNTQQVADAVIENLS